MVDTSPETDDLREAHATLTRILGAIDEYVYTGEILRKGGYRLVFAGPCRDRFLGLSTEEARTAVWRHYVHPEDIEIFDVAHETSITSGRLDTEYRLVGADGEVRWVRDRGQVRVEDGRTFLDGSILDITEIHTMQAQLVAARAEADRLAHVDPLTGTANRRSLTRVLTPDDGQSLGLLCVDLDRFKQVNDRYGHAAGDAVLVAVASRLRACVRSTDEIVRMGGEEFLVVIRDLADPAALVRTAEEVRHRIAAHPVHTADVLLDVTVSVGAVSVPAESQNVEEFLSRADAALYEAKRDGRNCVRISSS